MNRTPEDVQSERLLLAVDDSDASRRVLQYVARLIGGREGIHVDLYHRLPSLPAALREHGGAEDARIETVLREELGQHVTDWIRDQKAGSKAILESLRDELIACGVPRPAIALCIDDRLSAPEHLAHALRRVAAERHCHTIVVAREHVPGVDAFFHGHTGDRLVRGGTGFAVWVIE